MKRFDGKAVLVTGAASGIGLATTQTLAGEGAKVLACDIDAEALDRQVGSLRSQAFDVMAQPLDVGVPSDCEEAVREAVRRFGHLDVLCNIAGVLLFRHFTEFTDAEWARIFTVNVHGVFAMCRAAIPSLLEVRGNIVNMASAAGLVGVPYSAAYSASKAAVIMLSRSLALEYANRGLRVNAVCPGYVVTPMTTNTLPPDDIDASVFSRLAPITPAPGTPDDVAAAVAYLASDQARYVTGSAFVIDGGQTAI